MSDRHGGPSGIRNNPLFGPNRLKLGVFSANVSGGCAITTDPRALRVTWPNSLAICAAADLAGFEALVPVARWRGFGGESNFTGTNFEPFTWAAGIAQPPTLPYGHPTQRKCYPASGPLPNLEARHRPIRRNPRWELAVGRATCHLRGEHTV